MMYLFRKTNFLAVLSESLLRFFVFHQSKHKVDRMGGGSMNI